MALSEHSLRLPVTVSRIPTTTPVSPVPDGGLDPRVMGQPLAVISALSLARQVFAVTLTSAAESDLVHSNFPIRPPTTVPPTVRLVTATGRGLEISPNAATPALDNDDGGGAIADEDSVDCAVRSVSGVEGDGSDVGGHLLAIAGT